MAWVQEQDTTAEVVVAIPHSGEVTFDWATMLSSLHLPDHVISSETTTSIDLARERTVENALEYDPEWVLFLDSDIIPPRDVYVKLREHELDVVSAVYMTRKDKPYPAAWVLDEGDVLSPVVQLVENRIANVDAVGLGCCLVNSRVLKEIERPWFRWTEGYEEHPWDKTNLGGQMGVSEDFYFCHKIQEAGYNIYIDADVFCIHEDRCIITEEGRTTRSMYREKVNE